MKKSGFFFIFCITTFFSFVAGLLLIRFPPVSPDEVIVAVTADNLVRGKGIQYSLYDDIYPSVIYPLRGNTVEEARVLYNAWVGAWTRLAPRNYVWLRWSTLIIAIMAILSLFWLTRSSGGDLAAIMTGLLLLVNPVFWVSSCITGEHMLVFSGGALAVAILVGTKSFLWKEFFIWGLVGLLVGVHPNILAFAVGFFIFGFVAKGENLSVKNIGLSILGFLFGAILVLAPVNWKNYLQLMQSFYWQFIRPPLLSGDFTPLTWIVDTLRAVINPASYYLRTDTAWGWSLSTNLYYLGLLPMILVGFLQRSRASKAFGFGELGLLLGMAFLVRRKEMTYTLLHSIFIVPLAAIGLQQAIRSRRLQWLAGITITSLVASGACFAIFVRHYTSQDQGLKPLLQEAVRLIPNKDLKIAGPNFLWFGYEAVRDLGALVVSRYQIGNTVDMRACLSQWKPDVLWIDPLFRRIHIGEQPLDTSLKTILSLRSVDKVGTVESPHYGVYEIVRLQWE